MAAAMSSFERNLHAHRCAPITSRALATDCRSRANHLKATILLFTFVSATVVQRSAMLPVLTPKDTAA